MTRLIGPKRISLCEAFCREAPDGTPPHASFPNNNNNIAVGGYGPRTETDEEPEGDEGEEVVRVGKSDFALYRTCLRSTTVPSSVSAQNSTPPQTASIISYRLIANRPNRVKENSARHVRPASSTSNDHQGCRLIWSDGVSVDVLSHYSYATIIDFPYAESRRLESHRNPPLRPQVFMI